MGNSYRYVFATATAEDSARIISILSQHHYHTAEIQEGHNPRILIFEPHSEGDFENETYKDLKGIPAILVTVPDEGPCSLHNLRTGDYLAIPFSLANRWEERFTKAQPSPEEVLALTTPNGGIIDQLILKHYHACAGEVQKTLNDVQRWIEAKSTREGYYRHSQQALQQRGCELAQRYLRLKTQEQAQKLQTSKVP